MEISRKNVREFETIGFYLSDHPLNQYKDIFNEYALPNTLILLVIKIIQKVW